ncbi:MAG: helix-turn-helix domain-containing protein [archaeon]
MIECFQCRISGDKAILFDAICEKGIVKVCEKCSFKESIPIIRKPTNFQLRESEKRQTVHERLSRVAGLSTEKKVPENKELKRQETSLRDIIDRNFESKIKETKTRDDLVDNFHWILMRVRRLKKITQEQLAEKIGESAAAIKMAEKGVVPNGYVLIRKLENYLGVKLIKQEFALKEIKPIEVVERAEFLGRSEDIFKEDVTRNLTIADLQEMKKKKEEEIFEIPEDGLIFNEDLIDDNEEKPEFVRRKKDFFDEEKDVDKKKEEDISKEEIDKILFGR